MKFKGYVIYHKCSQIFVSKDLFYILVLQYGRCRLHNYCSLEYKRLIFVAGFDRTVCKVHVFTHSPRGVTQSAHLLVTVHSVARSLPCGAGNTV